MKSSVPVVFDCNVFLQSMISRDGPAHECWQRVLAHDAKLFVAPFIFDELRSLPGRKKLQRFRALTIETVNRLIDDLRSVAHVIDDPPIRFSYPRDPDDARYIDVAASVDATLVVSNDQDLLDLMDGSSPDGVRLHALFPDLKIVTPRGFLNVLPR